MGSNKGTRIKMYGLSTQAPLRYYPAAWCAYFTSWVTQQAGSPIGWNGLGDGREVLVGSNPLLLDTDGDGLEDALEVLDVLSSPLLPDTDGDGLADGQEFELGTSLSQADTDGDGLSDGDEENGLVSRLPDGTEGPRYTSNPRSIDGDGDGLPDIEEMVRFATNPRLDDTDGDGITDREEVDFGGQ